MSKIHIVGNNRIPEVFPDNQSPIVSNSNLTVSSLTETGFIVDFEKATDTVSSQSALTYTLYSSDTNNLDTVSNAEANGTQQSQGTDVSALSISGLNVGQLIYFNVVVEDEAGNKSIYNQNSETTPDQTSPTVSDKTLSTSNVGVTSFDVDFSKATDNHSSQVSLVYRLYTSTTNNIGTISDAEANGTLKDTGTDVAQLNAASLNEETQYYFNVIVEDEAGNKTAYTSNSVTTDASSTTETFDSTFDSTFA